MAQEPPLKRTATGTAQAAGRRTLLHNGCFVTCVPGAVDDAGDPVLATYSWLLMAGGRIQKLGLGDGPQELQHAADIEEVVDLGGRLVLPGLFDSHCHVFSQGKLQQSLVLEGVRSVAELQRLLVDYRRRNPGLPVIEGLQWDQDLLGRMPNRTDLDVVSVPVVLYRRCWHICCLNSAALEACCIKGGETISEGQVDTNDKGEATGILREGAMDHFLKPLRQAGTPALQRQWLRQGLDVFMMHGCTSVLTNDGAAVGGIRRAWERYQELLDAGSLPVRVFLTVDWKDIDPTSAGFQASGEQPPVPTAGDMLTTFRVKLWTDGALGASTAALVEPYSDDPKSENRGILQLEPDEIRRAVSLAKAAGFGVEAHTIGDRSARELLDAFAEQEITPKDRYALAHCQILRPELVEGMAKLGAVASIQPQFNVSDADIAPLRLGSVDSARMRYSYCWRTLREAGVRLAGGSDAPVEVPDPLVGMYCAMVHEIHPSQSLSFAAALEMYTLGGAFTAFREHDLGALQEGYCADLVVTTLVGGLAAARDAASFRTARVSEVWVGGARAYSAPPIMTGSNARARAATAPDGLGKRGASFVIRGPCPCCKRPPSDRWRE